MTKEEQSVNELLHHAHFVGSIQKALIADREEGLCYHRTLSRLQDTEAWHRAKYLDTTLRTHSESATLHATWLSCVGHLEEHRAKKPPSRLRDLLDSRSEAVKTLKKFCLEKLV